MFKRYFSLSLTLILAAALGGCAELKCSPENCAADAAITAEVRQALSQHPEFGAPYEMRVQTINHVVYLSGEVNSDLERQTAEALVRQIANVADVVNSLYPRSNSR